MPNATERLARWPALVAAAFGAALFFSQGGYVAIVPTRLDWIKPGSDWAYHLVAWLFYRNAPWQWPVGAIPDLLHPVGSTIVLTDCIPWVALPAKLLSPLLPSPVQLIGPWLFLCYVLAGWFGARLGQALQASPRSAAFIGAFFAISPALMHRVQHEGLTAHFLILWALAAAFSQRRATTLAGAIVPVVAFGVHPYLFAMTLPICLAALVRAAWVDRIVSWRLAGAVTLAMFGVLVLAAWVLGYFDAAFAGGGLGFSHYGTDLAAFVTTQKRSWFLPDLPGSKARWEGYAYLGAGGLFLVVGAIVLEALARGKRDWRRGLPLAVVVLGMALFALADPIRILGEPLVQTTGLWKHFDFLTGAFRTSGRFIWPAYYAVLAAAIGVWILRRPRWAPWVLGFALALQIGESRIGFFGPQFQDTYPTAPRDPAWELARGEYRHLVLFPPRCGDGSGTCCVGFSWRPFRGDTIQMMQVALLGLSTNSSGVGRVDRARHAVACQELFSDVDAGRLDPRTIYQIGGGFEFRFHHANPGAVCGVLDGVSTCVAADAPRAFRVHLAQAR